MSTTDWREAFSRTYRRCVASVSQLVGHRPVQIGSSDTAAAAAHHRIRTVGEVAVRIEAAVLLDTAAWQIAIGVGCHGRCGRCCRRVERDLLGRLLRRLTEANEAQNGDQAQRDEEQEGRDLTERVVEHPARLGERVGLTLLLIVLLVLRARCVIEEVDDGLGGAERQAERYALDLLRERAAHLDVEVAALLLHELHELVQVELGGGIVVADRNFKVKSGRMGDAGRDRLDDDQS